MQNEQWNPGRLLEVSGSFWQTCALHAAVKLDMFTALGDERLSGEELAARMASTPDGVTRLLNAITAMGLLEKEADRFANTPAAQRFLSKTSSDYIGYMIMHHHHLVDSWSQLDQAVQSGGPVGIRASFDDPVQRESFLMGMFNTAMNVAPMLIPAVELGSSKHLLDLGGGPGTYAIHFCQKYPELTATVYDLPTTRPFAEKTISAFGLAERIRFQEGNYLEDDLGEGYDAVWMSHILHGEGPDGCRAIIGKAVAACRPGGMLLIHEFILDDDMAAPPICSPFFSLNMLVRTQQGRAYSQSQLEEMLSEAGAGETRRIPIQTPNESGVIIAEVP